MRLAQIANVLAPASGWTAASVMEDAPALTTLPSALWTSRTGNAIDCVDGTCNNDSWPQNSRPDVLWIFTRVVCSNVPVPSAS